MKDRERLALKIAEALAKSDGLRFGLPYKPWERHGYVAADIIIAALTASIPPTTAPECPSCHGLNISCPEGCERDPATGELITMSQGEVIQADRDAAADIYRGNHEALRQGKLDDHSFVQAFRDHRLAFSHPSPRNVEKLPANDLTVPELLAERSRIEKLWDDMRGSDEELGGGSPGEWMIERLDEIDTTIKRLSHPSCEVERLREALVAARRAIGDHWAPSDCYATGPLTGNAYTDLVECPACVAIPLIDAALSTPEAVSLKGDRV